MKEINKKGVATSLFPSATCWPLASLVPHRHVLSVGTCSPSARVLRAPTYTELLRALLRETPHSFLASLSLTQHTDPDTSLALLSLSTPLFVLHTHSTTFQSPFFLHSLDRSTSAQLRVPPSSGASHPLSANRERTRLLPSASLVTVTGHFLHPRLADALPDFFPSPFNRKTFFLFLLFPPP